MGVISSKGEIKEQVWTEKDAQMASNRILFSSWNVGLKELSLGIG